MPLDPADVVATGLALLDEVGPQGFTMRALATRLGTYPATIYWHVGDRDRVLALVVDLALGEISVPSDVGTPSREWLGAVARAYRRVLHRHPHLAPLVASQVLLSLPTLGLVDSILGVLASMGFTGPALARAYNCYVGSVVGWVSVELARAPDGDWVSSFEDAVRRPDPARFPNIADNVAVLADQAIALRWHDGAQRPLDDAFEASVEIWLDGLVCAATRSGRIAE